MITTFPKGIVHMDRDESIAGSVITELRRYRDRIDAILGQLDGKRQVSQDERSELQALLTSLKSDLREAARRGTVGTGREPQNQFERAYFAPAVQSASANLHVAVNSHPIRSDWFGSLYRVQMDITLLLHKLEQQFPGL